jgi:organic radical activating enzyme
VSDKTIRLAETFTSLQGEGKLTGVPMHFVRLSGCSVAECPLHPAKGGYCDTDWAHKRTATADEIMAEVPRGIHWLSITGGEPTDQLPAVEQLVEIAHRMKMQVNLQTSGVRPVMDGIFDWLTVSPKQSPMDLAQTHGHEMKLVYTGQDYGILRAYVYQTRFLRYYLQPLWKDGKCNAAETAETVLKCAGLGLPWRLTTQMHKTVGIR